MQYHNNDYRPLIDLTRHGQAPGVLSPELVSQRTRFWVLALAACLLILGVYLFLQTHHLLARLQNTVVSMEDGDAIRIRQYNEKLEALQNQMSVFVADAVETKLKSLEKNVSAGTVGMQDVKMLEELTGEVKLLETYSAGKHINLMDLSRLDHPRFQVTPGSQVSAGSLLEEVADMKRLLYLSIASCGFVGLMIGGQMWQAHLRVKRLSNLAATKTRLLSQDH